MTSAAQALLLLLASGTIGVLGLWQLLSGTSRKAELAERGQAGAGEGGGRSALRALDTRFRRTGARAADRRLAGRRRRRR